MVADFCSILAGWMNHFSQPQNGFDVTQTEEHTAESLMPQLSAFELEMAIETIKRLKSPGFDQIPTEVIKSSGRTFRSEIYKLINPYPTAFPYGNGMVLHRSRTGTVWFYTSTSNKRAARPKQYTESLTRDLKLMYSRLTLVRISINL